MKIIFDDRSSVELTEKQYKAMRSASLPAPSKRSLASIKVKVIEFLLIK